MLRPYPPIVREVAHREFVEEFGDGQPRRSARSKTKLGPLIRKLDFHREIAVISRTIISRFTAPIFHEVRRKRLSTPSVESLRRQPSIPEHVGSYEPKPPGFRLMPFRITLSSIMISENPFVFGEIIEDAKFVDRATGFPPLAVIPVAPKTVASIGFCSGDVFLPDA
jgi:hypothetical protein